MIFNRNILSLAEKHLGDEEILVLTGARQVGKTVILKKLQEKLNNLGKNTFFLNLEDPDYLDILNKSPKNLFRIIPLNKNNKSYIFIDEVQYLKNPTNFLKYIFDEHKDIIKLIVSGSSAFYLDTKFEDSLAGRKKIFEVKTLNFREFLTFKQESKLSIVDFSNLTLTEIEKLQLLFEEYVIYGGYPKVVLAESIEEKKEVLNELVYSYIKKDVYESKVRQEEIFYRLLKLLSMQVGNLVNSSEISNTLDVSKTLIDNYLYILEKSYHIARVLPFTRNMRKELTKMPKIHFLDLGIRNFLANNFDNFRFRQDKGMFFENIVYKLLSGIYSSQDIRFWRTQDKHEVDFVLEDQKLAFEAKSKFRKNKFKVFSQFYPEIDIKVISFDDCWKMLC